MGGPVMRATGAMHGVVGGDVSKRLIRMVLAIGLVWAVLPLTTAQAAGGDFSIDFTAAAPETYDHSIGGGAFDDRTVGKANDVVESLEGGSFACGDIVSFLAAVTVDGTLGTPLADDPQTIELTQVFLANTTGQAGAALGEIVGVGINYGPVAGGDGPGGTDSGVNDDGGSSAVLVSSGLTGPLFQAGSELLAAIRIDDLEAGETVVLRSDVRLVCQVDANPTGTSRRR